MRRLSHPLRRLEAIPTYLILRGAAALFFALFATLASLRRVVDAGLGPLELVLVGTVLETTVLLFEVPTGLVADVYGRKRSVVIGYGLIGFGFVLESTTLDFATLLLAQVVWGIGATFISGAQEAWIADEVGVKRVGSVYLRGAQADQLGTLVGIPLATALGALALAVPVGAGGLSMLGLAAFLALSMPEESFRHVAAGSRHSWRRLGHTMRDGVGTIRAQPVLMGIVAIAVCFGMASEGTDRLWEFHFLNSLPFPSASGMSLVLWFGGIRMVALLSSLVATQVLTRRTEVLSDGTLPRVLWWLNATLIGSIIAFGLASNFALALLAYVLLAVCRRVIDPLFDTWTNRQLESETRATVLSIRNQGGALGEILGGPMLGAVGTLWTVRAAMVGAALLLCPVLLLYRRSSHGGRHEQ
jgi:DHA3 family tetracycline resistance protein-like MFS transporter